MFDVFIIWFYYNPFLLHSSYLHITQSWQIPTTSPGPQYPTHQTLSFHVRCNSWATGSLILYVFHMICPPRVFSLLFPWHHPVFHPLPPMSYTRPVPSRRPLHLHIHTCYFYFFFCRQKSVKVCSLFLLPTHTFDINATYYPVALYIHVRFSLWGPTRMDWRWVTNATGLFSEGWNHWQVGKWPFAVGEDRKGGKHTLAYNRRLSSIIDL